MRLNASTMARIERPEPSDSVCGLASLDNAGQTLGAGYREIGGTVRRTCSHRHDVTIGERKALADRLGQGCAMGDRMIDVDLDQAFLPGQRQQTLNPRTRYPKLRRNFILGLTTDIRQPGGPGSLIQLDLELVHTPSLSLIH